MRYISAQEAATKWGISKRRVQVLCTEKRIDNVIRIGNMWAVPENAQKPLDGRMQSHHISTPTVREARTALKKLTVASYDEINREIKEPGTSKMIFLSMLATALFCELAHATSTEAIREVYSTVGTDLLGDYANKHKEILSFDNYSWLISKYRKHLEKYSAHVDDVLSWAYQYVNKLSLDSGLENTQFFTETYMIKYLTADVSGCFMQGGIYLDPACGGGNFLSHILNQMYQSEHIKTGDQVQTIRTILNSLYGYELDPNLAVVASVNLKLKALSLLCENRDIRMEDWQLFCPNIYTSVSVNSFGFLAADFNNHAIRRIADGQQRTLSDIANRTVAIYTNPPFQTVKGMDEKLKKHLKKYFPKAKCDLCNAFIQQCLDKIQPNGKVGMVTQSSWMYLDSFEELRTEINRSSCIEALVELGSGAFCDLSGEKANVALIIISKRTAQDNQTKVLTLRNEALQTKVEILDKASATERLVKQSHLFSGEHFALSFDEGKDNGEHGLNKKYGDYGTPMQGTSTGNAAELISYYWEHLDDREWIPVSKGGGYSRWCGLNQYVLKWGTDGEYIRATKGSALRNTKFFDRTSIVYSDTGTAGFNARILENGQIFVASGPGIRDVVGNTYAHLGLLNSRLFSYYLRNLSPKLTVAAGYISRVSVPEGLFDLPRMETLSKECYSRKRKFLRARPNNLEWVAPTVNEERIKNHAYQLFLNEMQDEYFKLACEEKIDGIVLDAYKCSAEVISKLDADIGIPAIREAGIATGTDLDMEIFQAMDANCQLSRTRVDKRSLGCDGVLEYVARKTHTNPKEIVDLIEKRPDRFPRSIAKYQDLALHSIVLACLGFRTERKKCIALNDLQQRFLKRFPGMGNEWELVEKWIVEEFNSVHAQSFSARPYYQYSDEYFKVVI